MHIIKLILTLVFEIYNNKNLLFELMIKDLKQRYLGSYLGILWAFIQPIITVMIFWFVFEIGFKTVPINNVPFVLWLVCGMFPWFFFSDAWNAATNSITGNSYLVKKIVFNVSLLPIIQIMSALLVSIFFNCLLVIMFFCSGFKIDIYFLQLPYYLFSLICLVFGLSLISSSLAVFSRDISQIVNIFLQFGFWATPIFWNINIVSPKVKKLISINPMYYITSGYRDIFIYKIWFWDRGLENIIFWTITSLILIIGIYIFNKLKPEFADVI